MGGSTILRGRGFEFLKENKKHVYNCAKQCEAQIQMQVVGYKRKFYFYCIDFFSRGGDSLWGSSSTAFVRPDVTTKT
jgi:hypothetical protein